MIRTSTVGLILCFVGFALARRRPIWQDDNDCRGVPDGGVVSWGCRAYTMCQGQRPVVIDCSSLGLVYNPTRQKCDNKLSTPAPCGLYRDCRGKADGRYTDYATNCTAYYTCTGGKFFGHNQCNPGLVFNQQAQVCDWPYNVGPPCGTKGATKSQTDIKEQVKKPSRKITKSKSKLRRMKIARRMEEREMHLRMRLVKGPSVKRQYGEKRRLKGNSMLRETVHGM